MIKYTSNAKWPNTVSVSAWEDNVTTDTHDTLEAALVVCQKLMDTGLGGEREIFPIKVWVDDYNTDTPKSSEIDYENLSTERLLNIFRKIFKEMAKGDQENEYLYEYIKSILDKREHIPSKKRKENKEN